MESWRFFSPISFTILTSSQLQVMRILEESAQTDNSGKIVNGMNGLNLSDMTFHEVAIAMRRKNYPRVAGDQEDRAGAGRVRGCRCLPPTCQPPCPTWLQGGINPILQRSYILVSTIQVSEGFDGQTRTELLEAGNELDRVGLATLCHCIAIHPRHRHRHHHHHHHHPPPPLQVNHQLGPNLSSQGSRQTLKAAVQR